MKNLALLLTVLVVSAASAQDLPRQGSISCRFDHGTVGGGLELSFEDIDHERGRALVRSGDFEDEVLVVNTEVAMTFVERTFFGNITITTVFYGRRPWMAVASRHSRGQEFGELPPAQFYGTCLPKPLK